MEQATTIDNYSYGCELEWSDIDRSIDIPEELGSWEGPKLAGYYMGAEIDIVNTKGQWRGVGTDPLCLNCPVGGEINTVPSTDIDTQFIRIMRIMNLFPRIGVSCVNHGHIHVHVPGLKTDLRILKNFFTYLKRNENDIIRECCGYDVLEHDLICNSDLQDWVKRYLIIGDGKHISEELYDRIEKAETIEQALEYIKETDCIDWDCITNEAYDVPGSHRTAVNMFNLTKGDTIEFRIFRASLNPFEIYSCLKFAEMVVHEAVNGEQGMSVKDLLAISHYEFPKLNFNYELARGWQDTRQTKGRCGPFKKTCSSASIVFSDPIMYCNNLSELSDFDQGLLAIFLICNETWHKQSMDTIRKLINNTLKS